MVFSSGITEVYFDGAFSDLATIADNQRIIILTDSNIAALHKRRLGKWPLIIVEAGEQHKQQSTIDYIVGQLLELGADRQTLLVGVGGGVITDMAGYTAAIFMRGIAFGFVPTTLLAMADAAIGGKNGVDVGIYKNIVGTIRQPAFLLYDTAFLKTLPQEEWVNGFAEVIKHGFIKDKGMLRLLKIASIKQFQRDKTLLQQLIRRNVLLKMKIVQADEWEQGDRKLLNFGHTLGHAIENLLQLPHGHAVAIGMVYAAHFSAAITGFKDTAKVIELLEQYGLPTHADFDTNIALEVMTKDKKRLNKGMQFVLLEKSGHAIVHFLTMEDLAFLLQPDSNA